jgi:hypothetical protein
VAVPTHGRLSARKEWRMTEHSDLPPAKKHGDPLEDLIKRRAGAEAEDEAHGSGEETRKDKRSRDQDDDT